METLNTVLLDNSVKDYIIAFGIILGAFLFRNILSNLITSMLKRMLAQFVPAGSDQYFKSTLRRPISFLIFLIGFSIALNSLKFPDAWVYQFFNRDLHHLLGGVLKLLYVFAITWLLLRTVDFFMLVLNRKALETESKEDDQIVLFFKDIIKVAVVFCAILFILGNIFSLNISSLVAGAGIAGLAIALAAKESLENLLGSFTIFIEKPFTVGDYIQVGDVDGIVEKVGFRSTRIRTLDKSYVTLPNRKIIDTSLDNKTLRTLRRVVQIVGVEYGTTKAQLDQIIHDTQEFININAYTNEDGLVSFFEFGDSALNIRVEYYVNVLDWKTFLRIKEEVNFKIMEIVENRSSSFAFPTQTIHIKNE